MSSNRNAPVQWYPRNHAIKGLHDGAYRGSSLERRMKHWACQIQEFGKLVSSQLWEKSRYGQMNGPAVLKKKPEVIGEQKKSINQNE